MIRRGEEWAEPVPTVEPTTVVGGDADLARAASEARGRPLRFDPRSDSDLARVLGLAHGDGEAVGLAVDAMDVGDLGWCVNAVVVGTAPDRVRWWHRRREARVVVDDREAFVGPAFAVVIANGQFLRGCDLVPKGHPGDGRLEVQVYAVEPRERTEMRRRLSGGGHLPHPGIHQFRGRRVSVSCAHARSLEIDGLPVEPMDTVSAAVLPGVIRLAVGNLRGPPRGE
ncbi:MAG TPA: hypothetical protein VI916_08985 [Acidimicrobiia bacterium]|nr:hypothetical protein [Acidimicrobiia bacterium]